MTRQERINQRIYNATHRLFKLCGARGGIIAFASEIDQRYSGKPGAEEHLALAQRLREVAAMPLPLPSLIITCVDCGVKFTDSRPGQTRERWSAHRWNCPSLRAGKPPHAA